MYQSKYNKYKNQYLKLKYKLYGGITDDPELVDWDDEFIEAKPESEFPEETVTTEDVDKQVEQEESHEQNTELLGYNNTLVIDQTSDESQDKVVIKETVSEEDIGETTVYDREENIISEGLTYVDIGIFGQVKGKIYRFEYFDNFDEDLFINFSQDLEPNKKKIIIIDNLNSFDEFTDKYGYIFKKGEDSISIVYIDWKSVSDDFRGLYLVSTALQDREIFIPYQNQTVHNWVPTDYNFLDRVAIFGRNLDQITAESMLEGKNIIEPFRGKLLDPYGFNSNQFVKITDPINKNKILLLDNLKSFDKFTDKYGQIPDKSSCAVIKINWDSVNMDYEGFYIDKNNDFFETRYKKAFLNNNKYISWLYKNKIIPGIIYKFS